MQPSRPLRAALRRNTVHNPIVENAERAIQDKIHRAVLAEGSDKVVALKTGYAPRTANALRNKAQSIPLEGFLRMAAAYPEVADEARRWLDRMCAPDFFEPDAQKDFHQYMRALSERGGRT